MALFKQVAYYGPCRGFLYYNPTMPHPETNPLIPPLRDVLSRSMGQGIGSFISARHSTDVIIL